MLTARKLPGSTFQSIAACLLMLSAYGGVLHLWSPAGPQIIPIFTVSFCLAVVLGGFGFWWERKVVFAAMPFLISLLLLTFSSFFYTPYSLFPAPTMRGEVIFFTTVFFLFFRFLPSPSLWRGILFAGAAGLLLELYRVTGGSPVFGDDHATFIFRFSLLQKRLYDIPFYYPFWNGGLDARDFFATGALNTFILFSPLYALFDAFDVHTTVIGGLLFVIVPASAYLAGRLLDGSKRASTISAIIAIASSLFWYRWALKYGTLGFITSAALLPLGFALALALLDETRKASYRLGVASISILSLIACWSLSGAVFLPLAGISVVMIARLIKRPVILFVAAGLLLVNLPWVCVMWEASSVSSFISAESTSAQSVSAQSLSVQSQQVDGTLGAVHGEQVKAVGFRTKPAKLNIELALKNLRDKATTVQPLLLLFALPGVFLLRRLDRWAFGSTFVWLLFLGTFGVGLKPQLELDRMLIFAALLACFPTALFLERVLAVALDGNSFYRLIVSHALAYSVVGLLSVAAILNNRSIEKYLVFSKPQSELAEKIRELTPHGRVLFAGFVLHEFGGGHVAPLPLLTGNVPMVASSPFHNRWRYTNVIPDEFLKEGDAGIERFLSLYNVSTIAAQEKTWRDYFIARPDKYSNQGITAGFVLFTVKEFSDSYVEKGSADEIVQKTNGVAITPRTESVTLKFTYLPFLEASPCQIRSAEYGTDVHLVELYDCKPGQTVFLKAKNPLRRILEH